MDTNHFFTKIEPYLKLTEEEKFFEGASLAQEELQKALTNVYKAILSIKEYPFDNNPSENLLKSLSPEEALSAFWLLYFTARIIVENSYEYKKAEELINHSLVFLEKVEEMVDTPFIQIMEKYTQSQIILCQIDRGIYNGLPELLKEHAESLGNNVKLIRTIALKLSKDLSVKLYNDFIIPMIEAQEIYGKATEKVALLYEQRWNEVTNFINAIEENRSTVITAVETLNNMGANILAYDLKPHLPIIERIASLRKSGYSNLYIRKGRLQFSYFAGVNYTLVDKFSEFLQSVTKGDESASKFCLEAIGVNSLCEVELSDIWSRLAVKDSKQEEDHSQLFVKKYSVTLAPLQIFFRKKELLFEVTLDYFSMGIFCLNFYTNIDDFDVTTIRHAMSLNAPFSLDEKMMWKNRRFSFIWEFTDFVFDSVKNALQKFLGHNKPLSWEKFDNSFMMLSVDSIDEWMENEFKNLNSEKIQTHKLFVGLITPQREVRSAIDNWIAYEPSKNTENIAPIRYYQHEFMYVYPQYAIIGLLDQPEWVCNQAEESIQMGAIISNLALISSQNLDQALRTFNYDKQEQMTSKLSSLITMKKQQSVLEIELKKLNSFEFHVKRLLAFVRTGSIMTYSDHRPMMQSLLKHMNFDIIANNLSKLFERINITYEQTTREIILNYDKIQEKRSKRLNLMASVVSLLFSVSAVDNFLNIVERAGLDFSGKIPLTVTGILSMVILVVVLMIIRKN